MNQLDSYTTYVPLGQGVSLDWTFWPTLFHDERFNETFDRVLGAFLRYEVWTTLLFWSGAYIATLTSVWIRRSEMLPTQREWRHTCLEALKNEWSCVNVVCGIFTDAPGLWPCLRVRHVVEDRTPMFQRGSEFPVHDDKTLILLWLNCKQSVIGLVHILNTRHQGTYSCCIWVYPLLLESRIPRQIILDRRQIFSL